MTNNSFNPLAALVFLLLFSLVSFSGWKAWEQAEAYEQTTVTIIESLDTDHRIESLKGRALEWLSFGLYDSGEDEFARLSDLKTRQQAYKASIQIVTTAFFGLLVPLFAAAWWIRRDWGDVAYSMLAVAAVALAVGLSAPVLSVEASREIPLLGHTVFQFESKGVLTTITALREAGNTWLALLLFAFSVVIPLLKTLLVGMTFFARTHHWSLRGYRWSHQVGKWSMTDVFVVAILVAFFATNDQGMTQAEIQAGLWFFTAYVILSLSATQLIGRLLRDRYGTG